MRAFWNKQGQKILSNERYASVLTAALSFLPFTEWLALAALALVTLRKGWQKALFPLMASVTALVLGAFFTGTDPYALKSSLLEFLLTYFLAILLRFSASWSVVSSLALLSSLLSIYFVHQFSPSFIADQYQLFLSNFKSLDGSGFILDFLQGKENVQQNLANYLLGLRILGLFVSVYCSLTIARAIQSDLFYPGEFKKELLGIRANKLFVILLILCIKGARDHQQLALSCLPLFLSYFFIAGLSLFFSILSKKKQNLIVIILVVSFIIVPYVLIPTFVLLGSLDSLFNFRLRLLPKVNA